MFKKQQWIKAIVYRFYSVLITFIVSYIFTGNLLVSLSIGLIDSLVKIFSYYAFDEIWDHFTKLKIKPGVVFLTGLSGSGKTTLARSVIEKLQKKGLTPVLLDGDEIRNAIKLTGFDEESRKRHNLNVGYMAKILESQGKLVVVSLISPYADIRDQIRGMCDRFIEVHVSTDISVCMQRDTKGLYEKALKGEIKDFTGVSAPYFPPNKAELVIDTAIVNVDEGAQKIINALRS
ncbi:MAG: adenylyl-sulfate kinase [Chitinophagaceae bacterium]|nr:adenylyl-sulfate kinase [Chitinophagaceae bacterium]